ncbi:MAG: RNase adapter RapZ [Methylocystaceae bacterium]
MVDELVKKSTEIVIITGLSGAGKTLAASCLEDLGYFCVDNLPPALLTKFIELADHTTDGIKRVAFGIDVRGGHFFGDLAEALAEIARLGYTYRILFLDTSVEVLIRRFKESRRRHPLAAAGSLQDAILLERSMLEDLRGQASIIIDTSELSPQQFKEEFTRLFNSEQGFKNFSINVVSFGYKWGLPSDADLVFDVRFLPNPYYVCELREFTGHDQPVADYVMNNPLTAEFNTRLYGFLGFLLPYYLSEGKAHLMIALGCTGGQHRSVALTEALGEFLSEQGYEVVVKHRDIERKRDRG